MDRQSLKTEKNTTNFYCSIMIAFFSLKKTTSVQEVRQNTPFYSKYLPINSAFQAFDKSTIADSLKMFYTFIFLALGTSHF